MRKLKPTVVVIAPLALDRAPENLGATAKIEVIIGILGDLGFDVHLVDSSHPLLPPGVLWARSIYRRPANIEGDLIHWSRPFTIANRRLGKLLNILILTSLVSRLISLKPSFIWIYNAYAYEGRLALKLATRCKVPIVLELEDLPLARIRGLNPKPYLDEYYFRRLLKKVSMITYVNHVLMKRYDQGDTRKLLLPSILRNEFLVAGGGLKFSDSRFTLGYFGGLEIDKGAGVLLEALPMIPPTWQLVVTGRGKLKEQFEAAAIEFPDRLVFLGVVDRDRMTAEMHRCDAIVNPHRPISAMGDGVFPFKVCESIAAGALLISTPLPEIDIDTSRGILFFSGSSRSLVEALVGSKEFYTAHRTEIEDLRAVVCDRFGRAAVEKGIAEEISHLVSMPLGAQPRVVSSAPVKASSS